MMSVTAELHDPRSRLSRYLRDAFPFVREVQEDYRSAGAQMLVPRLSDGNPATVGGAFDWRVRYLLDPAAPPFLAVIGAAFAGYDHALVEALAHVLTAASGDDATSEELLARGCWALSLLTEVARTGMVMPGSPLAALAANPTCEELLALASPAVVDELTALTDLARRRLVAPLLGDGTTIVVGPAADGTFALAGDADFVIGDTLVEMKTTLGRPRRDGTRRLGILREELYQLVTYLLYCFPGIEDVRRVALYSARYGHLHVWDAQGLLNELAFAPVPLERAREAFRLMLAEYSHT